MQNFKIPASLYSCAGRFQPYVVVNHEDRFSHVDLIFPAENMLIQDINGFLHLKITDFGSAKLPYNGIVFIGWTPEYMAQESCQYFLQTKHDFKYGLTEDDITGKVDVFALFLVILYMYSKKHVLLSLMTNGKGSYSGYSLEERQAIHMQLIVMVRYIFLKHQSQPNSAIVVC